MRVRREQPHHGHRVDGPASGTGLAVGEQLLALALGGECVHGRNPVVAVQCRRTASSLLRIDVKAQAHEPAEA